MFALVVDDEDALHGAESTGGAWPAPQRRRATRPVRQRRDRIGYDRGDVRDARRRLPVADPTSPPRARRSPPCVAAQVEAGLGALSDGRVHAGRGAGRRTWSCRVARLARERLRAGGSGGAPGQARGGRAVRAAGGSRPGDATMRSRRSRARLAALADAGCPVVEVHEPAAPCRGRRRPGRVRGRARALLLGGVAGATSTLSLAITGGDAIALGAEALFAAPYRSHLFDLVDGPRQLAARRRRAAASAGSSPASATRRAAAGPASRTSVWAAGYAASTQGRGLDRVGIAPSGSLAGLDRGAAPARSSTCSARPPRTIAGGRDEVLARLDPRAIDARSAALGHYRPARRRDRGRPLTRPAAGAHDHRGADRPDADPLLAPLRRHAQGARTTSWSWSGAPGRGSRTPTGAATSTRPRASGTATWATAGRRSPTPPPRQLATLAAYSNFGAFATAPTLELADRLAALAPMEDAVVFFGSGGSDGVDTAAKLARRYWDARAQPEKRIVVSREHAYHGMHAFGTGLAGIPAMQAGYGGPIVGDTIQVSAHDVDGAGAALQGPRQGDRRVHRRAGDRRRRGDPARGRLLGRRSRGSATRTTCCSSPTR